MHTTALIAEGRGGGCDGKNHRAEALRGTDVGQLYRMWMEPQVDDLKKKMMAMEGKTMPTQFQIKPGKKKMNFYCDFSFI